MNNYSFSLSLLLENLEFLNNHKTITKVTQNTCNQVHAAKNKSKTRKDKGILPLKAISHKTEEKEKSQ